MRDKLPQRGHRVLAAQPDRPAALRTFETLHDSPALMVPVVAVELSMLGAILVAVGLARGHVANWVLPAVAVLVAVASVVKSDSDNHVIILAGFLPLAVLWAWLALIVAGSAEPGAAGARDVIYATGSPDLVENR